MIILSLLRFHMGKVTIHVYIEDVVIFLRRPLLGWRGVTHLCVRPLTKSMAEGSLLESLVSAPQAQPHSRKWHVVIFCFAMNA